MGQPAFRTRRVPAVLHRHEADSIHPLHVGLWRDHAYKFFGSDTESLSTLKLDKLLYSSHVYADVFQYFCLQVLDNSLSGC